MEISGRVLREVEFRDRLRGYDTEEVDEFLEKVAVAVDDLLAQLDAAKEAKPSHTEEDSFDDDSLRRTLVLAQRTADLAIKEARDEAGAILDDARAQAEELVGSAREESSRLRSEAETSAKDTIHDLEERKVTLETEVSEISNFIDALRKQLVFALQGALETVGESLKPPQPTSSLVRKRLEAAAKSAEDDPPPKRERDTRAETEVLAGPPTEAVTMPADDEDAESADQLSLVQDEEPADEDKPRHSHREEKSSRREEKASRKADEDSEDIEDFAITGEEAIVSVESVVDPDEELWQRWAKGADLDGSADERHRSVRQGGRAEKRGGGFSA